MNNPSGEIHQKNYVKAARAELKKAGISPEQVSDRDIVGWYVCNIRIKDVVRIARAEILQDEEEDA